MPTVHLIPNYRGAILCVAATLVNIFWEKCKDDPREKEWDLTKRILTKPLFFAGSREFCKTARELGAKDVYVLTNFVPKDKEELLEHWKKLGFTKVYVIKDWDAFMRISWKEVAAKREEVRVLEPVGKYIDLLFEVEYAAVEVRKEELTKDLLAELLDDGYYIVSAHVRIGNESAVGIIHGFDGREFYVYPPRATPIMTENLDVFKHPDGSYYMIAIKK